MREFVMYKNFRGWRITACSNYKCRNRNGNKILDLGNDYKKAEQIAAHNFGLENVTIIKEDGTIYERSY